MSILFSQVPEYLHDSKLYLSLIENIDENINEDFEIDVNGDIPPNTENVDNITSYIINIFSI